PSSLLIVGAGVFGLSTALALTRRPEFKHTTITVVDRSPEPGVFPSRDASSIDTSRIIRADYADPAYAALAAEAQEVWRQQGHPDDLGAQGRYSETGLLLVADESPSKDHGSGKKSGLDYVLDSYENVLSLTAAAGPSGRPLSAANKIQELPNPSAIRDTYGTGGCYGSYGYINRLSGWADAEASMDWLFRQVKATGRVTFINGTVTSLLHSPTTGAVTGVALNVDGGTTTSSSSSSSSTKLEADLTVLATGAWTPTLVNLTGRAIATGQALAYMDLTDAEQARLAHVPTLLNLSTGYFIITPGRNILKIARHAYGYLNPTPCSPSSPTSGSGSGSGSGIAGTTTISLPVTHLTQPSLSIPRAEQDAMRRALAEMVPWPELQARPFRTTRLCWYTDTPDGDFIIDYHPEHKGLFLATGGSGHGFKFLPVIGDKITDCILDRCPEAFRGKWALKKGSLDGAASAVWDGVSTEDGSRGGVPGLILSEEM
ncbi:hypothetical protein M406DRAFT_14988, partial [Cryphonectria parasitica EP155]